MGSEGDSRGPEGIRGELQVLRGTWGWSRPDRKDWWVILRDWGGILWGLGGAGNADKELGGP